VDRKPDGTYENGIEVYYAVTSIDTTSSRDPEEYAALAAKVQQKAPRIGAYLPYSALPAAVWPVRPWRQAGPVTAEGAPPILVVGGTRDPATPYAWAEALAKELPGAGLLTRDGDGHTSFFKGNECIDDKVIDYLVNLKLPPAGTVCAD
jgi:pimeloyl-ACP methyl ester carboxylesterase